MAIFPSSNNFPHFPLFLKSIQLKWSSNGQVTFERGKLRRGSSRIQKTIALSSRPSFPFSAKNLISGPGSIQRRQEIPDKGLNIVGGNAGPVHSRIPKSRESHPRGPAMDLWAFYGIRGFALTFRHSGNNWKNYAATLNRYMISQKSAEISRAGKKQNTCIF